MKGSRTMIVGVCLAACLVPAVADEPVDEKERAAAFLEMAKAEAVAYTFEDADGARLTLRARADLAMVESGGRLDPGRRVRLDGRRVGPRSWARSTSGMPRSPIGPTNSSRWRAARRSRIRDGSESGLRREPASR